MVFETAKITMEHEEFSKRSEKLYKNLVGFLDSQNEHIEITLDVISIFVANAIHFFPNRADIFIRFIGALSVYLDNWEDREKTGVPWRELFKDEIEKFTESGLMLKGARAREDLTQKELAEKLSVKTHHISEMENGKKPIDDAMAKKLSAVLNFDHRVFKEVSDFLGENNVDIQL